jgi:hypothetical protein
VNFQVSDGVAMGRKEGVFRVSSCVWQPSAGFGFGFGFLLRWHGGRAFTLASAICLRISRVAPVRGGTYFSLPAAKKSRQKKAAQTEPLDHRQDLSTAEAAANCV